MTAVGALVELEAAADEARRLTERRNALIHELRAQGLSLRTIAEAAGLSHTAVAKILSAEAPAVR